MKEINGTGMKRVALINDLSCFGKCSLGVAIPIVSSFGCEAVPLPTAILSTHTGGFENYVVADMTDNMIAFARHWKQLDMKFDCIYTGFFGSLRQIEIAKEFIRDFADKSTLVIVDPVLGDNGRLYPCFSEDYIGEMRGLCELADVITPNRTEAALLTGKDVDAPTSEILDSMNNKNVVVTGVRRGDKIGYSARFGDEHIEIFKDFRDIALHGTGDVFASAFCGELMSRESYPEALRRAADFCDDCVEATVKRQPSHWYGLSFEDVLKKGSDK